ncbi:MAG: hypothetical protein H0X66_17135 [Verrucomicrobia bacterium]|nr:hypothetical protein [Verrucomicrobiota bacterium]
MSKLPKLILILFAYTCLAHPCLFAQSGILDTQFSPRIYNSGTNKIEIRSIANIPDGRLAIGGSFTNVDGKVSDGIAVLLNEGDSDQSFRRFPSYPLIPNSVRTVAVDTEGNYFFSAMSADMFPPTHLHRLSPTGASDDYFDIRTGLNGSVLAIASTADNKIVAGGAFTQPRTRVAQFLSTGFRDDSFDPGATFVHSVSALILQPDGKILAGSSNLVARLQTNGILDATFNSGTGPNGNVFSLALQPNGKILVGGSFTEFDGVVRPYLARLMPSGDLDPTFTSAGVPNDSVRSIALQSDGRIVIAGDFTEVDGSPSSRIARLTSSGALDPTFNGDIGINDSILAMRRRPDGSLVLGGVFSSIAKTAVDGIAKISGTDLVVQSVKKLTNGHLQLTVHGSSGTTIAVEASPDLTDWTPITTAFLPSGEKTIEDHEATNHTNRFYRIHSTNSLVTDPLDNWTCFDGTQRMLGVAWGRGQFVIVGDNVRTSADGMTWVSHSSGTSALLFGVGSNDKTYVAVGSSGAIITSPDAITWTTHSSGVSQHLYSVTWGGSRFVAVGNTGTILTSSNGVVWNIQSSESSANLRGVTWNGSQFVAVGASGTILTSPDGVTWTSRSGTTSHLHSVTWNNLLLVVTGSNGTILTSVDGVAWESRSAGSAISLRSIVWDGKQFAVAGFGTILTSPDGITWTNRPLETSGSLISIASNGEQFVAIGSTIVVSANGLSWGNRGPNENIVLKVHWSTNWYSPKFVAVGYGSIATSSDGIGWLSQDSGTSAYLNGITGNSSLLVAVGNSGTILTSQTGLTWTQRSSGTSLRLEAVAWGKNQFVAVGDTILTSPDGISWTQRNFPNSGRLYGITCDSNLFVAVGEYGSALSSPDGINWTTRNIGSTSLAEVASNGMGFVAVGAGGAIRTSPDGISWSARSSGTTQSLFGIAWGADQFIATGFEGTILTSPNGTNWTTRNSGTSTHLLGTAWNGRRFVVVGAGGTVLRSGKIIP